MFYFVCQVCSGLYTPAKRSCRLFCFRFDAAPQLTASGHTLLFNMALKAGGESSVGSGVAIIASWKHGDPGTASLLSVRRRTRWISAPLVGWIAEFFPTPTPPLSFQFLQLSPLEYSCFSVHFK